MTDRSNSLLEINFCLDFKESDSDDLKEVKQKIRDLLLFFADKLENSFSPTKEKKELLDELLECLESFRDDLNLDSDAESEEISRFIF